MMVGVLAMQGAFREHALAVSACGCAVTEVRHAADLERIRALIIPGGESTAIGRLLQAFGLGEELKARIEAGLPVFGTCAGAILLAKEIVGSDQFRLGVMDIRVRRNAYGRQVDSFEVPLEIPVLGDAPFPGVFIRAPQIEAVAPGVEVLASYQGKVVLARQGKLLAATFHPELTPDLRVHRYFLEMASS